MAGEKLGETYVEILTRQDKMIAQLNTLQTTVDKKAGKMAKSFEGMFKKVGRFVAAAGLGMLLKNMVQTAAQAEGVKAAFDRLGQADLLANLRKATRGTVDDLTLMKTSMRASNFKIPLGELATMLEFAQKRASQTGESVDYLVNSIVDGIGRKSTLVLDNLGISATELQQEVKRVGDFGQATGNIVRRELAKMGDVALTSADRIGKIKTTFENLKTTLGSSFLPVVERVYEVFEGFTGQLEDASEKLSVFDGVANVVGTGLIVIMTALQQIGTLLGTVAAALVKFWSGDFGGAWEAAKIGSGELVENFKIAGDEVYNMWKDLGNKIKNEPIVPKVSGGGGGVPGGPTEEEIKKLADANAKVMDDLKFQTDGYYKFRVDMINKEAEAFKAAGVKEVEIAKWVTDQLRQLQDEQSEFFIGPDAGLWDDFETDGLEAFEKLAEQSDQIADAFLDSELKRYDREQKNIEDAHDERMQSIMSIGNSLESAFGRAGKSLISFLNTALQTAIKISNALGEEGGADGWGALAAGLGGIFSLFAPVGNVQEAPDSGGRGAESEAAFSRLSNQIKGVNSNMVNFLDGGSSENKIKVTGSFDGTDIYYASDKGQLISDRYG